MHGKSERDLNKIIGLFQEEMQECLAGIYLHGSLSVGCYNPETSDIDLLVIAKDKLAADAYIRIARGLLAIDDGRYGEGGIEVSIVLETYMQSFVYPTPFEFHYSPSHRESYRSDSAYVCGDLEDPDLAAHAVVSGKRRPARPFNGSDRSAAEGRR
ncbi:nucleotidyltransferase domain-containing protein [Paenibacillus humicola]|uniref:nucleotidyltransferase domain-containing protein n=1 Tax=Paenibacillus humicola TaxID=3110540 RepID=UPI00237A5B47|nr:nucleotidyltransferase domain-containing protein [Paenibacillus humicola]